LVPFAVWYETLRNLTATTLLQRGNSFNGLCNARPTNGVLDPEDNYVAWCRYTERGAIVTCDSDASKAFKVYRHPSTAERYREALEEIAEPIKFMRQRAEAEGGKINGAMAVALSEDHQFLKSIALAAIRCGSLYS
jgi:hypothetical protein